MKLKFERNMRILTDVMGYCVHIGAQHFLMELDMQEEYSLIKIRADVDDLPQEEIDRISSVLNTPRQREMEQNYWNLTGGEEVDGELLLAGIMVDEAEINYEGGHLEMLFRRLRHPGPG